MADGRTGDVLARVFSNQLQKEHVLRELLDRLGVGPGDRLLDVSGGAGLVSLLAAERVGPGGGVWALEARPEVVAFMMERQAERGLSAIRPVAGSPASFALPDPGIDRFVIADALHRTPGAEALLGHLGRILPPGARGVVSDYDPDAERRVGAQTAVRLPVARVRGWLEAAGFAVVEAWRPPDEHYAFVVERRA